MQLYDLCDGDMPVTGGFPSQGVCDVEGVSMVLRHMFLCKIKIARLMLINVFQIHDSLILHFTLGFTQ